MMKVGLSDLIKLPKKTEKFVPIDLSVNNVDLVQLPVNAQEWSLYIEKYLTARGANIAYGGYLEIRNLYDRSVHFSASQEDKRNIHLGLDLWTHEENVVTAPFEGRVHSKRNNDNFGDFGPTIILEHEIHGHQFYSLYGHLSLASLEIHREGEMIQKGQTIGFLGDPSVNGDYAPHLHFQLIKDLQGKRGDYPGVCSEKQLAFYSSNCPDPLA